MEEIPGLPGAIPKLIPFPPEIIRTNLAVDEWQMCLDSWLISIDVRLRLRDEHFSHLTKSPASSGTSFLSTYFKNLGPRHILPGSKESQLYKFCYLLSKRLVGCISFEGEKHVMFDFLSGFGLTYQGIPDCQITFHSLWKREKELVVLLLENFKKKSYSITSPNIPLFDKVNVFVMLIPAAGVKVIASSDYLEFLMERYRDIQTDIQMSSAASDSLVQITKHLFYCFKALMSDDIQQYSLLLDHLYHMKSFTETRQKKQQDTPTLLSSLVCTTSFLRHFRADSRLLENKRGQDMLEILSTYKIHNMQLHPPSSHFRKSRPKSKGKQRAKPQDMHIHRASQISQIQELFPDLPNGYIMRLLDHFNDDVESVTAALLEPDSLPPDLQDQSIGKDDIPEIGGASLDLAPTSAPEWLSQRRNAFDDEPTNTLTYRGRKEIKREPETVKEHNRSKAAIMAALAVFDADDDERDDTYDVADVGGTIDDTVDNDERRSGQYGDPNEDILFRAWKDNPELFTRDSNTRMSKPRQQLQKDTGMSAEQIEGWAIMLKKDPKLEARLSEKYSVVRSFGGNQRLMPRTKWQGNASGEESHNESEGEPRNQSDGRRMGQAQIRGNRNWGSGRGKGSTSSLSDDHATQMARKRKEQGRGRGGASHRRDARAKKIGRGMGGPTQ